MKDRTVKILARNLEAAKNIAKQNKSLNVSSGEWLSSVPEKHGGLKTYSFQIKKA